MGLARLEAGFVGAASDARDEAAVNRSPFEGRHEVPQAPRPAGSVACDGPDRPAVGNAVLPIAGSCACWANWACAPPTILRAERFSTEAFSTEATLGLALRGSNLLQLGFAFFLIAQPGMFRFDRRPRYPGGASCAATSSTRLSTFRVEPSASTPSMKLSRQLAQESTTLSAPVASICAFLICQAL